MKRLQNTGQALRMNAKHEDDMKADWHGDVVEQRELQGLHSENALVHYFLGVALEAKADSQGALQEYRAAYEVDPRDLDYRQAYEHLLQRVRH
jgi:hypothetical protein